MDNAILYVQVQEELSSLLLHCLDAKDKIEISRRFAHSQATIKSCFFQGSLRAEEVLRLQQLHSMRYLLHGKKAAGDQQVAQAYGAVSAEINKLLGTVSVPSTPKATQKPQTGGFVELLMETYRHTMSLPDGERLAKTVALVASIPQVFAKDPLLRKILLDPQEDSSVHREEDSSVHREDDSEEEPHIGTSSYRSEGLLRLLSPHS